MEDEVQNAEESTANGTESNGTENRKSPWRTWTPIGIAALALVLSVVNFFDNRAFQTKASSVDAMKDHLTLSIEQVDHTVSPWEKTDVSSTRAAIPDEEYKLLKSPEEKQYVWYASHALFTAETIYNWQVGDDVMWEDVKVEEMNNPWLAAARQFVQEHWTYIRWNYSYNGEAKSAVCTQYSKGFISFMREESKIEDLCPEVA